MRTIEKGNFSFMIRCLAWNEEYVQTSLICREFRSHRFWSLDHPKVENLALDHKVVAVADSLMNLLNSILWIAWNDTVHKSAVYAASLLEPCLELLAELPELYVLIYALLEFLTVKEDKLAWQDDETLCHIAIEMLISAIEELSKLTRI